MLGASPSHPKYSKQIVINLNNDPVASLQADLLFKALKHPIKTYYIQLCIQHGVLQALLIQQVQKNNDGDIFAWSANLAEAFSNLDHKTRIYIRAHGTRGNKFINTDDDSRSPIYCQQLAQWLVDNIPATALPILNIENPLEKKLKISLLVCDAATASIKEGSPSLLNNSFAANFSYCLKKLNIDCVVSARQGILSTYLEGDKSTSFVVMRGFQGLFRDLFNQIKHLDSVSNKERIVELGKELRKLYYDPHDADAKLLYYYEHGVQKVISAYEKNPGSSLSPDYVWKKDAFSTINRCIEQTKSAIKKQGLYKLLYTAAMAPDIHSIYLLINEELLLGKPGQGYHVHTHNDFFGFGKTKSCIELENLLQRFPHV